MFLAFLVVRKAYNETAGLPNDPVVGIIDHQSAGVIDHTIMQCVFVL